MVTTETRLDNIRRHLRGVKRRLLWVAAAFGFGASLTWYFNKAIIGWLLAPAHGHLSPSGLPVFTGPTEVFTVTINLVTIGGVVFAVPMLAFHLARFFRPLMSQRAMRLAALSLPAVFACYLVGAAFAYWVLLPTGLGFLLQFGAGIATPMVRISEYMDLALALLFWMGVVFELPLAMFLLSKLHIVSHQRFRRLRRHVSTAAIIFSILVTPTTDYVNMLLVAVPIVLLYEVGVLASWLAWRKP